MNDTRETLFHNLKITEREKANNELGDDIPKEFKPLPRFKIGQKLRSALHPNRVFTLDVKPFWDREFSGWMIAPGFIGIHESNFILAEEIDDWIPVSNGLWSYWIKKNMENKDD